MDDSVDTLGLATRMLGPDSITGMETTASAQDDRFSGAVLPVDLSFLAPSSRIGSLGRIGEYEIIGVLGRGAMGIVLKGHDRALKRVVAVKVQDPSIAMNRRWRARFLREARAVGAINHPSVVTIYKVNIVQDRPYLAMEFVARSLRDRIRSGEPLEILEVLRIALQVAEGLAAAHAQGVLHRDIKPANILLEDGAQRVKISDFGLAMEGLTADAALEPENVVGTPAYMSPEQVRNEPLDGRSDLFSFGCVIYAMLAGRSPFGGESAPSAIASVLEREPPPPPQSDHRCSGPLCDLVMTLLSKAPEGRPESAAVVVAALRGLVAEANQIPSAESLALVEPSHFAAPQPLVSSPAHVPSPPWFWPSLAVVTLAVVAVTGLVLYYPPPTPSPNSPAPPAASPRTSWTVAQSGAADFPDLVSAVRSDALVPGSKLVVTDNGRYEGALFLNDPKRHRDLTIEAAQGATLSASAGYKAIVAISGVPGVTLRGFNLDARSGQFAVTVTGLAEGVTLDHVHVKSPKDSLWTQVWIHEGATGSQTRPIVVSRSTFEVGKGGVTIEGDDEAPVRFVEVRGNRFLGDNEQAHILQNVRDVTFTGNLFVGGQGITINLSQWRARDILVANNTFFRTRKWIHPADSDPDQEGVVVCNNAILESLTIDVDNQDLSRMARGHWAFHHNVWEPSPGTTELNPSAVAESRAKLGVLSRDPESPNFLRPSPTSALCRDGAGGDHPHYAGALAPALEDRGP